VAVPDPRFDRLCALTGGREEQHKPPIIQITDIAGLVEGACKGEGLGNAFLHHVSVCHVLFHVVRGFADLSIEHVKGNVDPVRDMAIIATELRLKDLQAMEKRTSLFSLYSVSSFLFYPSPISYSNFGQQ
jgi:ribosome-binding ATPase YchF (GTP1/OBG family)